MRFAQLAIMVGLFSINSVQAEDEKTTGDAKPQVKNAVSAEPMSIFNDEVRRFKFQIEHEHVSIEMARIMMASYLKDENAAIIGAYPERLTNSLVFIASPEAEPAIRKALATRIIELWGAVDGLPTPLEDQKVFFGNAAQGTACGIGQPRMPACRVRRKAGPGSHRPLHASPR